MSIENKFRAYLATLDGSFRDFSSVEHLFEDLYHSGFVLQENENILDRKQMKQFHAKAFEMGSRATLLLRDISRFHATCRRIIPSIVQKHNNNNLIYHT
jgi:hypothetical protein